MKKPKPNRAKHAVVLKGLRAALESERERTTAMQAAREKMHDQAIALSETAEREAIANLRRQWPGELAKPTPEPMRPEPERPKPSWFERWLGL